MDAAASSHLVAIATAGALLGGALGLWVTRALASQSAQPRPASLVATCAALGLLASTWLCSQFQDAAYMAVLGLGMAGLLLTAAADVWSHTVPYAGVAAVGVAALMLRMVSNVHAGVAWQDAAIWSAAPWMLGAVAGAALGIVVSRVAQHLNHGQPALGSGDVLALAACGTWLGPLWVPALALCAGMLGLLVLAWRRWRGHRPVAPFAAVLAGVMMVFEILAPSLHGTH